MLARILVPTVVFAISVPVLALATSQQDLDDAARHKKVAFVLVSEPSSTGTPEIRSVVLETLKRVKKSVLVELDRTAHENTTLVARLGVAGAPAPLILVVAPNGAVAAGFGAANATVEALVAAVPSPKQADALKALQDGKSVFLVVSPKGAANRDDVSAACTRACADIAQGGVVLEIDMDDKEEDVFLTQLKVDRSATAPVILVVNSQGQITGSFMGTAAVPVLVETATKKLGGCCPPSVAGPAKSCPPTAPPY